MAWEHDIDRRYFIERGGRARFLVGNVARDPAAYWFYTARSASYAPEQHAAGWRFNVIADVVEFDVVVSRLGSPVTESARFRVALDGVRNVRDFSEVR